MKPNKGHARFLISLFSLCLLAQAGVTKANECTVAVIDAAHALKESTLHLVLRFVPATARYRLDMAISRENALPQEKRFEEIDLERLGDAVTEARNWLGSSLRIDGRYAGVEIDDAVDRLFKQPSQHAMQLKVNERPYQYEKKSEESQANYRMTDPKGQLFEAKALTGDSYNERKILSQFKRRTYLGEKGFHLERGDEASMAAVEAHKHLMGCMLALNALEKAGAPVMVWQLGRVDVNPAIYRDKFDPKSGERLASISPWPETEAASSSTMSREFGVFTKKAVTPMSPGYATHLLAVHELARDAEKEDGYIFDSDAIAWTVFEGRIRGPAGYNAIRRTIAETGGTDKDLSILRIVDAIHQQLPYIIDPAIINKFVCVFVDEIKRSVVMDLHYPAPSLYENASDGTTAQFKFIPDQDDLYTMDLRVSFPGQ
ncbi:MAG: hypothetical protein HY459_02500 [Parcubacteria group bacterium]|nr:hypothetical protein [Parcubacteria group bacterium]